MCDIISWCTVKREYLASIIFGVFSNLTTWRRINLEISNTGISKDWDIFIWWRIILTNFSNSPILSNKLSPIINHFTVYYIHVCMWILKIQYLFNIGENCQYLPCDLNPCGERGLCTNDLFALPLGFQCQCFDGFTGLFSLDYIVLYYICL